MLFYKKQPKGRTSNLHSKLSGDVANILMSMESLHGLIKRDPAARCPSFYLILSCLILFHLILSYLILSAWAPKALAAERSLQHSYVLSNVWRATRDLRGVQPWRKSLGLLWPSPLGFCSIVSSQGPLTQGPVRQLGTYASTEVDLVLWTSLIFLCTLP